MQLASALNASDMDEAIQIIKAAGIDQDEIHQLMMEQALVDAQR